jgi:hypothetical protein
MRVSAVIVLCLTLANQSLADNLGREDAIDYLEGLAQAVNSLGPGHSIFDYNEGADPGPLLRSLSRSDFEAHLGPAKRCNADAAPPCELPGDWYYSLYKLAPGEKEGGPALLLQFDSDDRCSGAKWVSTQ